MNCAIGEHQDEVPNKASFCGRIPVHKNAISQGCVHGSNSRFLQG